MYYDWSEDEVCMLSKISPFLKFNFFVKTNVTVKVTQVLANRLVEEDPEVR